MAIAARVRTPTAAGVIAAFVLVLVFGSPPYADWARSSADPSSGGGWLLQLLAWPSWQIDADAPLRDVAAVTLRALLVVVLAAVFLAALSGPRAPRTGEGAWVMSGWAAFVFACAAAGLLGTVVRSDPSLVGAFDAASQGAGYGLFTGWIIGLATLAGPRRGSVGRR